MGSRELGGGMRIARIATLTVALTLVGASSASAVTRYAAPGGTATPAQCTSPNGPYCSIGTAAGAAGVVGADEAVILPGNYSDSAGDLDGDISTPTDGTVNPAAGSVHGVLGAPRPVITIDDPTNVWGAFFLGPGTLRHVTIENAVSNHNLSAIAAGAVVDGVIARNTRNAGTVIACNHTGGIVRNSVCSTTGSGAVALGASNFAGGVINPILRGVTAVSTGTGSFGLNYFFSTASPPQGPTVTVSAKSVIAQGGQTDVMARATVAPSSVTINLDHSSYDTTNTFTSGGGTASVTAPGTNFNITAAPLLAADGYHQLPGSPTINAGQTDGSSGTTDIDGQARQIGLAASDIGADERGVETTTSVTCAPASVSLGAAASCTAIVQASAEFINGTVSFGSSPAGSFAPAPSCAVSGLAPQAQCSVTFTPSTLGAHSISAQYAGGTAHEPSQGSGSLTVTPAPVITPAPVVDPPKPAAKCPKGKKLKKVKGKRKCVKKKKKKKRKKKGR